MNRLTDLANCDEISGFPVYKALLCEVVKVEEGTEASCRTAVRKIVAGEAGPVGRGGKKLTGEKGVSGWNGPLREREGTRVVEVPRRGIYLDNNATTRLADAVREAMRPFLYEAYGNPSSIHRAGRSGRKSMEGARRQIARLINCRARRLIFTGSGSESDNLPVKGIALARREKGRHVEVGTIQPRGEGSPAGADGSRRRAGGRAAGGNGKRPGDRGARKGGRAGPAKPA